MLDGIKSLIKPSFFAEFTSHPCCREMMIRTAYRNMSDRLRHDGKREREKERGARRKTLDYAYISEYKIPLTQCRKQMKHAEIYMYTRTCDRQQPPNGATSIHRSCVLPWSARTLRRGEILEWIKEEKEREKERLNFYDDFSPRSSIRVNLARISIPTSVHSKVDFAPLAALTSRLTRQRFLSPTCQFHSRLVNNDITQPTLLMMLGITDRSMPLEDAF